ncbi:MAG: FkbM family methyltransferase [Robiginitomaculum sp.]|nr:FkbM family methyltransferase [Robiginitomaculum sp.]
MRFNPYFSIAKRLMRLRKKPIRAQRLGAAWELFPSDWIDNRLFIDRPFEVTQLEFAATCIKDHQLEVFFDIGANIGLYSVLLPLRLPTLTKTHSFEPIKNTYARLRKNIELNQLQDKVQTYNFALGAKASRQNIVYDKKSSGTSSLNKNSNVYDKVDRLDTIEITIKTLDDEINDTGLRAFFKIDVEGHEAETLMGMQQMLLNNYCILQVELWPQHIEAITKQLANLDYEIFHQIDHDYYFRKTSSNNSQDKETPCAI